MSLNSISSLTRVAGIVIGGFGIPAAVRAETGTTGIDTASLVSVIGAVLIILLAVVIGLSVVAKVLIVSGVVSREPKTPWEIAVHVMADIVGRVRPHRSIRDRRNQRFPDRPERF